MTDKRAKLEAHPDASPAIRRMVAAANLTTKPAGYKNGHAPGGYNRTQCPVTGARGFVLPGGVCAQCDQEVK